VFFSSSKKPFAISKTLLIIFALTIAGPTFAQVGLPIVNMVDDGNGGEKYSLTLQLIALMTVLTLLPSLLLMMTSFVRIIIVMSLLRQALGTAQTPPNQVLVGLALFLTLFIMSPVISSVYDTRSPQTLRKPLGLKPPSQMLRSQSAILCLIKLAKQTLQCLLKLLAMATLIAQQMYHLQRWYLRLLPLN
jgi:flagellar biosynthesis protein FliP